MGKTKKKRGGKTSAEHYRDLLNNRRPAHGGKVEKRPVPLSRPIAHSRMLGSRRRVFTGSNVRFGSGSGSSSSMGRQQEAAMITGPDRSHGHCVAVDCEFVGTGTKGFVSMLGRCSVVNHHGHVLYDTYVAPLAPVTDYRTLWSGIRKDNLIGAPDFSTVQSRVMELFRGRIVVGHALQNDLQVLDIVHPPSHIRDTARFTFSPFQRNINGKCSKLKTLLKSAKDIDIQLGEHCSVEDARAAMMLYQSVKVEWEALLAFRY